MDYLLDLTTLIKKLILDIKDKNNQVISEFRFIEKDEFGSYKPYLTYNVNEIERTIIATKLWLYMLFKKAYTMKHIANESIDVYIKYIPNELPHVIINVNKSQYNKIMHHKNLGQFADIEEIKNITNSDHDLMLKVFIKERDIDIKSAYKYNDSKWNLLEFPYEKYDYYMYKFNPFVF